jgi:hypothetical protein
VASRCALRESRPPSARPSTRPLGLHHGERTDRASI